MMIRLLLVMVLLSSMAYSKNASLIIEYGITKGGYFCVITNTSNEDVLIKDMENSLLRAFGKEVKQFKRGKNWTYLRKKGSGFTSDYIIINISAEKPSLLADSVECDMYIASYDKLKRVVSKWKRTRIKMSRRKSRP